MTKSKTGLPGTIPLQIPTYWTPEQALAVFELVNDLRDAIWRCYDLKLLDEYRDQLNPVINRTEKDSDDPTI